MDKTKRSLLPPDYITSDEYFMGIAYLASKRSMDPDTRVGACIVSEDNKIVGIGYNTMPNGCENIPWTRPKIYVCHAEMNAIINKNSADVKNCKIYVTLFPCDECAKFIIQSGIKEIIYSSDIKSSKASTRLSKEFLNTYKIKYNEFKPDYISEIKLNLGANPDIEKPGISCIDNF